MRKKVILVWFRNDLRTHDNEVLGSAIEKGDFIIPVYIFDRRYYQKNKFGFSNTGELRHQYTISTLKSLKSKLQSVGADLLTYEGLPEEIIPQLVQKYDVDEVYHHREVAQRETRISELVEEALWKVKRNLKHFIGHTLYHKEDLPFPIKDIPDNFNVFKKKIERESTVRQPSSTFKAFLIPPHLEKTGLPEVDNTALDYTYGEDEGIKLLDLIIQNQIVNDDLYTVLSPYLAIGSLSPIYTYHYLSSQLNDSNKKGVSRILDGLLRRDYYRFMLKKHPSVYFNNSSDFTGEDNALLEKWRTGQTGNEQVDDIMRTLNSTGNISYADREKIALFLLFEYQHNWLAGASWFEQQLIDYAPATTYGYWAHLAGQGTSSKENRTEKDWHKIKSTVLGEVLKESV